MKKNLVGPMIRYRPASLVKLDMPRIDIVQKSTWQLLQDSKSAGKVGRWGLKEWNSALSGISTDKDSTMRGMHVFKEMKSYGIVPDTGTYHSLVKCCRSQPRFLMVIHEHAYKESVRSEKLLFNNEYLIDLIRYFVEARNPSQVAHLWQDVVTVKLQLSTLTILQFMRAFAIIKDEAKIIKLSEILVARRSNNPWDLDVNHSLMSAYLAVKNYEKVCKLFQFMRIQPTLYLKLLI